MRKEPSWPLPQKSKNRLYEFAKGWGSPQALYQAQSSIRGKPPQGGFMTLKDEANIQRQCLADTLELTKLQMPADVQGEISMQAAVFLRCIAPWYRKQPTAILEVDMADLESVTSQLFKALERKDLTQIQFCTGLGGTPLMPTQRLGAYVIPALEALIRLQQAKEKGFIFAKGLPTFRVFKANHIACHINGYNLDDVLQVSDLTFAFLKGFVERFYPQVSQYVAFESDQNWPQDNPSVECTLQDLAKRLPQIPHIQNELSSVMKMGRKHGGGKGEQNALLYVAAHPLYNQSLPFDGDSGDLFSSFSQTSAELIVDFGGIPQKVFNTLGHALREDVKKDGGNIPALLNIVHRAGKTPVYYHARKGDVLLGAESKIDQSVDLRVKQDFSVIEKAVGIGEYFDFVREFTDKHL